MRVALGDFEFRDWEIPDSIPRGGKQNLAVRKFPGGNVSIQNMGPDYRPITWSGMFIGSDAYDRMMALGMMRTAGKSVLFSTDKYSFPVVIDEFLPVHKNDFRIPFSITLIHVVDQRQSYSNLLVDAVDKMGDTYADSSSESQVQTYIVKEGDTLWSIAQTKLDDPNKWEKIYLDNADTLVDGPNNITPGMELKLNA